MVTDKPFLGNSICSFTGFKDGVFVSACASPNAEIGFEGAVGKQWNVVPHDGYTLICSWSVSSPSKRLLRERLEAIAIAVAWWLTLKIIVKGKPMKPDTSASKYTIVVSIAMNNTWLAEQGCPSIKEQWLKLCYPNG